MNTVIAFLVAVGMYQPTYTVKETVITVQAPQTHVTAHKHTSTDRVCSGWKDLASGGKYRECRFL